MLTRILIWSLILLTLMMISLGGYVHNTGSSLACPDWPLCFGKLMPPMRGGILIEHGHRMLGSLIGFLTILLLVRLWRKPQRNLGIILLFMVCLQGLLGGLTVLFLLPPLVSIAHLALSLIYFCSLILLLHRVKQNTQDLLPFIGTAPMLAMVLLLGQIVSGAVVRHFHLSGVYGYSLANVISCEGGLNWGTTLHVSHRLFGVMVAGILIVLLFRFGQAVSKTFRRIITGLLLLQLVVGVTMISTAMRPLITMFHLTIAASLFGLVWYWALRHHDNQITSKKKRT